MQSEFRRLLRAARRAKWVLKIGLPHFSDEDGRRAYGQKALDTALLAHINHDDAEKLVSAAVAGDEVAHRAIIMAVYAFASIGEPCPLVLVDYLINWHMRQPPARQRGPRAHGKYKRDQFIRWAVKNVMSEGFSLSRNEASRDASTTVSAASIVALALRGIGVKSRSGRPLDEKTIAEIVNSRSG